MYIYVYVYVYTYIVYYISIYIYICICIYILCMNQYVKKKFTKGYFLLFLQQSARSGALFIFLDVSSHSRQVLETIATVMTNAVMAAEGSTIFVPDLPSPKVYNTKDAAKASISNPATQALYFSQFFLDSCLLGSHSEIMVLQKK